MDVTDPTHRGQIVPDTWVPDDMWLVSFMDYHPGYFDLKTRVLEPLDNSFGPEVVTPVAGTFCYPGLRGWTQSEWSALADDFRTLVQTSPLDVCTAQVSPPGL